MTYLKLTILKKNILVFEINSKKEDNFNFNKKKSEEFRYRKSWSRILWTH